jgi:hypothetical protein
MTNISSPENPSTPPTLLTIPLELRLQIYDSYLRWSSSQEILYELNRYTPTGSLSLTNLFLTCRQVRDETLPLRKRLYHNMVMSIVRYSEAGYRNFARGSPSKLRQHGALYPLSSIKRFGLVVSLEEVARATYRMLYLPRDRGAFPKPDIPLIHAKEMYVVMCTCSWFEQVDKYRPLLQRTDFKRDYGLVAEQYMIGLKVHLLEHRSIQKLAIVYCGAKDCFQDDKKTTSEAQFTEPAEALVKGVAALPDHIYDGPPIRLTTPSEAGSVQFSVSGSFKKLGFSEPQLEENRKPWEKWLHVYNGEIKVNFKQENSGRNVSFDIYSYRGPKPTSCLCLMEVGYRPERPWPTPFAREVWGL